MGGASASGCLQPSSFRPVASLAALSTTLFPDLECVNRCFFLLRCSILALIAIAWNIHLTATHHSQFYVASSSPLYLGCSQPSVARLLRYDSIIPIIRNVLHLERKVVIRHRLRIFVTIYIDIHQHEISCICYYVLAIFAIRSRNFTRNRDFPEEISERETGKLS